MSQLVNLTQAEIVTWLTRVTQTIDRSLGDGPRAEAMALLGAGLDGMRVSLPVLAQLALLDDCLRVAHLAIEADGRVAPDELARVAELVRVATSKYFFVLPLYEGFGELASEPTEVARFLRMHRSDPGPFGYANAAHWRGLHVARLVERHTRNGTPLREHERMLARVMDEVFAGRATEIERNARRRLRELFEPPPPDGADPRALAFCRDDGPEVFSSVAHGSHIHERDPFDVDAIHAEAREVFHHQLVRTTTPEHIQHGHGRTMLMLGGSGSGKTHLLRAFRAQVHGQRLGYAGYLQMTSEVGDYARYVLRNLIDSMERPYDAPVLAESALLYLSDGLVDGRVAVPPDELERLRTAELGPEALQDALGALVDRVVRTDGLAGLETDLVQALLLLQRRDPALQRRVVKYLRCEDLNAYDRRLLGGLAPRTEPEDPLRTLRQLATLMHELQLASLVLMVDQIEEAVPDGQTITRLQQAFDTLRAIADAVPSAVVVIACLDDVYDAIRPRLSRSLVDRLERDPAPVRLASQRERDEIEQILIRRLEHLYSTFDVAWRDDDPLFPFTSEQLDGMSKLRARDCLARFRAHHAACIAARDLVPPISPTAAPEPIGAPEDPGAAAFERLWRDAVEGVTELPEAEAELLDVFEGALRGVAFELDHPVEVQRERTRLVVETPRLGKRILAFCNRAPQGGHLGNQFDALRELAAAGTVPVALRGSDFEFKSRSKVSKQHAALLQAGGLTISYGEHELRAMAAARLLAGREVAGFAPWRRAARPLARLAVMRALLDLDVQVPPPPAGPPAAGPPLAAAPVVPAGVPSMAAPVAPARSAPAGGAAPVAAAAPTGGAVATAPADGLAPVAGRSPGSSTRAGVAAASAGEASIAGPEPAGRTPVAARGAPAVDPVPAADPRSGGRAPSVRGIPEGERARASRPGSPTQPESTSDERVRLGTTATLRAEPVRVPLEQIKTHLTFIGGTGSGKTTAALSVVEQLLERGVSVLLVDRKGDLARYASPAWWSEMAAHEEGRKAALRDRVDVALYTPGNTSGRPLRLPLVPSFAGASTQERTQLAEYAANGLAGMMGYGAGTTQKHRKSVLQCAIQLHADGADISLDDLLDTVNRPDPELLRSVASLQRHFAGLSEDLQTLRIQRGPLLAAEGEPLDLAALLPPPGGRPRLSIINTSALTEVSILQFWVSRLLIELARLGRRRPSKSLQAVAFFDEADAYVPAVGTPPTKQPMFDLLRRARSTGIGVMLATQNPGDFDYKARDNIGTWLVGKVAQDRAIDKMRNLLAGYPTVGTRLATQPTGHFFVLAGGEAREIRCDRSLMTTEQLSDHEVVELAHGNLASARA